MNIQNIPLGLLIEVVLTVLKGIMFNPSANSAQRYGATNATKWAIRKNCVINRFQAMMIVPS